MFKKLKIYPLQLSSFQMLFMLPFALKFTSALPILIYFLNLVTSMLVHSNPLSNGNIYYTIDLIAISFWGLINTYFCLFQETFPIIPMFFCFLVFILSLKRKEYPIQSKTRIQLHMLMHFFGVIGTILLINQTDPNLSFSLFTKNSILPYKK